MRKLDACLIALGAALAASPGALSRVTVEGDRGPSTLSTPFITPTAEGVRLVSVLRVGESVNPKLDGVTPYRMVGIPDGLGAYDNGDGTFTLLMNHELGSTAGVVRTHGAKGAFVSAWRIDSRTLRVVSGGDLTRTVQSWNFTNQAWENSPARALQRLCSADLAEPTAFHDPATGKGTADRLFLGGEETDGGAAFAHVASGPNAGVVLELPGMGRDAWENVVASPFPQEKTVVIGIDDSSSPGGQVYVYVGSKSDTGNEVQRAGLSGGTLYAVRANDLALEDRTTGIGVAKGVDASFTLVNLGDQAASGAPDTDAAADAAGATEFLRPEDGAWDPSNPADFYFVTTDRFDQTRNGTGATVGRSRLWRLRFSDIADPENGGSITMLLDGTEAHNMLDNLCVSRTGFVMMQEDPGGQSWQARIWRYGIASGDLVEVARHDVDRFGSETVSPTAPFTNDEESSGILDASGVLGAGWFLLVVQAHYNIGDAELAQDGQLLALYDPATGDGRLDSPRAAGTGGSLRVTVDFQRESRDSLAFRTDLPLREGTEVDGLEFTVDIGGVLRTAAFDASGNALFEDGDARLQFRTEGGQVYAQRARFSMRMKDASFAEDLADDGLVDATVEGALVEVPFEVRIQGRTYRGVADLRYRAKAGRRGTAN